MRNTQSTTTNSITIADLLSDDVALGKMVRTNGWIKSVRTSKAGFSFIHLNDGSCLTNLQIVVEKDLPNYTTEICELTTGCSIQVEGMVVESQGKNQDIEVKATEIKVVGWVKDPETYPISKKQHSLEYLRSMAHLRIRTNTFGAVSRIRHVMSKAIHDYFDQIGFFWVNTPIITTSDCEGAGELFRVSTLDKTTRLEHPEFFGTEAFLTVSGQLNLEAYSLSLTKVYTFGPTFRAENSNTSRHLAEFWMVEPEIAFANLSDNANLAEEFLKYISKRLLERCQEDLIFLNQNEDISQIQRLEELVQKPFQILEYTEAIEALQSSKQSFEFPVQWGVDLKSEHERYLCESYIGGPVIIINYPKDIKAFYMRLNDDNKTVAAMDVLLPGVGEIIGGSQREERLSVLDQRMSDEGLKKDLWWYRDLRKYGTTPHAGFGLGLERFLLYVTGMDNIRDSIPFPRTRNTAGF